MARKGFTDRQGREWLPDPTGRFTFRVHDDGRWSSAVCMVRGQEPGDDPEGADLLAAGIGATLDPADPRTDVFAEAAADPSPAAPSAHGWQHRVATTSFEGLTRWLDEQSVAGWELVSILRSDGPNGELVAVFKRRA